jgi:hypothetical protein
VIGKVKARGVGDMMARVGGCGASVVTSSGRDWLSRVRRAGMIVLGMFKRWTMRTSELDS